jgi:hypothetical protein
MKAWWKESSLTLCSEVLPAKAQLESQIHIPLHAGEFCLTLKLQLCALLLTITEQKAISFCVRVCLLP